MSSKVTRIVYLKYGELTLKGKNRMNFINCLYKNVVQALSSFKELIINRKFDSMELICSNKSYDEIFKIAKMIPGISQIIEAYKFDSNNLDEIENQIVELIKPKEFKTFKVITNRHDKSFPITSYVSAGGFGVFGSCGSSYGIRFWR